MVQYGAEKDNKYGHAYPAACYCDKNYLICAQFFLCFRIYLICKEYGYVMSFLDQEHCKDVNHVWWGNFPLMEKKSNSTNHNYYRNILGKCGVESKKVLHQKVSGAYFLTKMSCNLGYQVNAQSRHNQKDIFYQSYVNWQQPRNYTCMAGLGNSGIFYLPRSNFKVPFSIEYAVRKFFPYYHK